MLNQFINQHIWYKLVLFMAFLYMNNPYLFVNMWLEKVTWYVKLQKHI